MLGSVGTKWREYLLDGGLALCVFAGLWGGIFVYNLYTACRVLKIPPIPRVVWTPVDGFELTGGDVSVTPEFSKTHHQYVIEITSAKDSVLHSSINMRFQFPFVIEGDPQVESNVGDVRFNRAATLAPVRIHAPNAQSYGKRFYKYYVLSIPDMPPNGKVRIVVMLDSDPPGWAMALGSGKLEKPPSLASQKYLVHARSIEFVKDGITFSYGGLNKQLSLCAPFRVDDHNLVDLEQFTSSCKGMMEVSESP